MLMFACLELFAVLVSCDAIDVYLICIGIMLLVFKFIG